MFEDILLVAPYPRLVDLAEEVRQQANIPFKIILGNLDERSEEIDMCIQNGIKVVVSRGGTAQYLRQRLSVPVVDIPVTSFDILNAISKMDGKGFTQIAFITTANIIVSTEHFQKIMDISLRFEPCKDVSYIPDKVRELTREGIEAVIGDVTATHIAAASGIYGQLLESGYQSLLHALNDAQRVLEVTRLEKARVKQMEAILNMISEAVLAIDKQGDVTLYNVSAEKIFGRPRQNVLGHRLAECLPESKLGDVLARTREEKNLLVEVSQKKIISNRIPILIDGQIQGAVAIFEEISNIQKLELSIRQKLNEKGFIAKHTFAEITNNSNEMVKIVNQARRYAKSDGTILIYGETGTGKELFAQSIHNGSKRDAGPFVSINCAALSEGLLESELFGYEGGAFTGASKGGKQGLFELAHGGSIFLDEIGEISPSFQAKLLRVLQEKEIRRVGGDRVIPIDVRIICATNRDLKEEVKSRRFREDLYYRLSVLEINLPPLRARKADVISMAISFLRQECIRENKNLYWHDDNIFRSLPQYEWYGNSRELHNFVDRLVICSEEGELKQEFIEEMLRSKLDEREDEDHLTVRAHKDIKRMEAEILSKMLERCEGDKNQLCRELNISRMTLWRKMNYKSDT